MTTEKKLEKSRQHRNAILDKIEFWESQIDSHASEPLDDVTVGKILQESTENAQSLDDGHKQIRELNPTDFDTVDKPEYFSAMKKLASVQQKFRKIKTAFPVMHSILLGQTPLGEGGRSSQNLKLPKLEISPFHGDYLEWTSFKDSFDAAIHRNGSLSNVQKLAYLKTFLKGEAARYVADFSLTDTNYGIALQQLNDRYQNNRKIATAILDRFFAQPKINGTSKSVKGLIDATNRCIRSLGMLGYEKEKNLELIMVHQMVSRLDPSAKDLWEHHQRDKEIPELKDLSEFLERHATALDEQQPSSKLYSEKRVNVHYVEKNGKPNSTANCAFGCTNNHPTFKCRKLTSASVQERWNMVKGKRLCFNCLRDGHSSTECSHSKCKTCDKPHNTMLHQDFAKEKPKSSSSTSLHLGATSPQKPASTNRSLPLMATAVVLVPDIYGQYQKCRVMLDNGSSDHFITKACALKLCLKPKKIPVPISIVGLGQSSVGYVQSSAKLTLHPHFDTSVKFSIDALIVPQITGMQPQEVVDHSQWKHIHALQLADPKFYLPEGVDILVGAELYFEIIGSKKLTQPHAPVATQSALGWILGGGRNHASQHGSRISFMVKCNEENFEQSEPTDDKLDQLLQRFWEVESVPSANKWSPEEKLCDEHFMQTFSRDNDGRFIVRYPMKTSNVGLGDSLQIAIRRFKQVEKRLHSNPSNLSEYSKFMKEYEALGHMVQVDPPTHTSKFRCYLPHHFVIKTSSTTTKFRVVFDASAKTSNGNSLNDAMMVGPVLQDSLSNLIIRFRKHPVAMTADVEKMYRQILIHPDDQELQHIIWRESPDKPLKHFKLLTVTYGTAAGPFLATKALILLSELEGEPFPLASKAIREDFYVDDCMTGASSVDEAIHMQQQLITLLSKGGFAIRKFTSNSETVLQSIPEDLRETKSLTFGTDASVKALGIKWDPVKDCFGFQPDLLDDETAVLTKRKLLSEISTLFDPEGWVSPLLIRAKMLMQTIWKEQIPWDRAVTSSIKEQWTTLKAEISQLHKLKIPRLYATTIAKPTNQFHLLGFCDASELAYSACVYLCTIDENRKTDISLIASKTRVAPVKSKSLPKLELSGAVLLAELMPQVHSALKLDITDMHAYTDSTITCGWIKSASYKYKAFVGNRISRIQELVPPSKWRHVPGISNPADCASRGIGLDELVHHPLWWKGQENFVLTDDNSIHINVEPQDEMRIVNCHTTLRGTGELLSRYSTLFRLTRITAIILRFVNNTKAKLKKSKERINHRTIEITVTELNSALNHWIVFAQQEQFEIEITALTKGQQIPKSSKIAPLNPFVDKLGILRVGGRLRHAEITWEQKYPILLPRHHQLTTLIIRQAHFHNLHAGPQALLSVLQQQYWIIRGKDAVKGVVRRCVTCTRFKATTMSQIMGDLPSVRVNQAHPFENCGLDYAGPFQIKPITPRSKTTLKAYIAIFICCATRAIHLEVVTSASTDAFLATLRRFIARRGKPSKILSDNGSNFVGTEKEMKDWAMLINSDKHNKKVGIALSKEGITWRFNPPSAPHHGGLWEAGVKSTKYHLRRTVGQHRLTYEELSTISCQIESILNSLIGITY